MRNDETVEIPAWAAREAHDEFGRLIESTGGEDAGVEEANTPLAEVRQRIYDADIDPRAHGAVIETIDQVAEERNVDVSGEDPLVDRTFQARSVFETALLEAMTGDEVTLKFHHRYVTGVLEGEKTKTIRHDCDPVDPGDTLVMVDADKGETFARAPVKSVWGMDAETLVHPEIALLEDGHQDYDDVDELLENLNEFYPQSEIGPETSLTIIQWADVEEADDE